LSSSTRAPTGIAGLDSILCGGLPTGHLYLLEGNPGVGKTTLALQFLMEGIRRGERCLYITLSETKAELDTVAQSHGWDLSGIVVVELSQVNAHARSQEGLFQASEMELFDLSRLLVERFEEVKPQRMVLDSLSELRLMAQNPLRYRRQVLSFKTHFASRGCTVLVLDDRSAQGQDAQVQSIVHGVLSLQVMPLKFGIHRRYVSVSKLRGSRFREGNHDFAIRRGGVVVFPRLVAADHNVQPGRELFCSGNAGLDLLTGGGFHAGTSNLFIGPAGSGKSTVASMFASTAARAGHKVLYLAFDESAAILLHRAREIGLPFDDEIEAGTLRLQQVDPAEVAPGELASQIMDAVESEGVRVVVLDSLNGYVNAMPGEEFLHLHLHELLTYLNQRGVVSIMILSQHGLIGAMGTPVDVSYIADTVMLMRFFESRGSIKKAVSVIKKRSGHHETTIRELTMSSSGVHLGEPLVNFEGVMTGVPRHLGGELLSSAAG
jgi:circadian clock protein KaiC